MYSFRACRRTDRRMLRTERWLDVELMVRVRLSPPNLGIMGDFGSFAYGITDDQQAVCPKFRILSAEGRR